MLLPSLRVRLGPLLLSVAGLAPLAACAQGVAADGDSDATDSDATDSDTTDSDTSDDGPGIDAGPFDPDAGPPPDATSALTGWQPVAPPLAAGADYAVPALTIDAAGKAIVAFLTDPSAGTGAAERSFEVQRAVAGEWHAVGERLSTANYLTIPQITAAPGGELWLTWTTGDRSAVRRWDGATWTIPAGTPLGDHSTYLPHTSVAIGPDGEPWVAYDEHVSPATNEQVYVRSGARYPGESGARQPVHTVYGGAHLFTADTARKLGELALRALETYAPDAATFAERDAASTRWRPVYSAWSRSCGASRSRTSASTSRTATATAPDAEEDGHAAAAATEVAAGRAPARCRRSSASASSRCPELAPRRCGRSTSS
jgi:hypothetical protein